MVQEISIKNFRCFQENHFEGFKQINLITGKNNVGKSALLEAIRLRLAPTSIDSLQMIRNDNLIAYKETSIEVVGDTLFYDPKNQLSIRLNNYTLFVRKKILPSLQTELELSFNNTNLMTFIFKDSDSRIKINENYNYSIELASYYSFTKHNTSTCNHCLKLFSKLEAQRKKSEIINFLQIIDPDIEDISITTTPITQFQLARQGERFLPLGFFGDAIQRALNLILVILDFENEGVLLIDEIENGIHYSNQEVVWDFLFKITKGTKIQIFATTHSLDLIKAFNTVAQKEEYSEMAGYMQMTKRVRDGKILGTQLDLETLNYALERNPKHLRGE